MRGSHRDPRRRESIPDLVEEMVKNDSKTGDPGMTRTCDLRFRKPSLYPAELRDRSPAVEQRGLGRSIPERPPDRQSLEQRRRRSRLVPGPFSEKRGKPPPGLVPSDGAGFPWCARARARRPPSVEMARRCAFLGGVGSAKRPEHAVQRGIADAK